ncbi:MAG: Bax inhibitor-1/YccA family protein [bacterium]|nr:Bax inhibitor-1/YccA family protein [bacterium]
MKTGNPALSRDTFAESRSYDPSDVMSIQGTVNKSFILLFLLLLSASFVWNNPGKYLPLFWPALIGGFVIAMVTIFKTEWAPVTAPVYALLEGVILSSTSVFLERLYPGVVLQAVGLTFGTLFSLLLIYKSGIIKVTDNFRFGVFAATGGIALYYFIGIVLSFFGKSVPLIYDSGPLGIIFSLFVVVIAAFNLVLDFDLIEKGAKSGAPGYMEWYGAFSLMVTLIWLYLEILRLLFKMRDKK